MRSLAPLVVLAILLAPRPGAGAEPPAEPAKVRAHAAIAGGVKFLLGAQNPDGSFSSYAQASPFAIRSQVPGGHRAFKAASSALALMALLKAPGDDPALLAARSRAAKWLVANSQVKRADGEEMYSIWALAYGLQALSRCLAAPPPDFDAEAAKAAARGIIRLLVLHQTLDGGWTYYDFNLQTARPSGDSMTFTTATVLVALSEAKPFGLEAPAPVVAKAVRSLKQCRTPEGMYTYSYDWRWRPTGSINRKPGSLTRTPACDLALYLFDGGVDAAAMTKGVENLLAKAGFARMAYHRPIPHESWFAVSGYFYLYGYYYAAEAIRRLPKDSVAPLLDGLIEEVLYTRHPDGSFWDYQLYGYHKIYGTGYAVLALSEYLAAGA